MNKSDLLERAHAYFDEVSDRDPEYLEREAASVDVLWDTQHHLMDVSDLIITSFKDDALYMLRNEYLDREHVEMLLDQTIQVFEPDLLVEVPEDMLEVETMKDFLSQPIQKWQDNSVLQWTEKCKHIQTEVPGSWSGRLTASGSMAVGNLGFKEIDSNQPKFGLYADKSWIGINLSRNEFINWPDMGVPVDFHLALEQLVAVFSRLVAGEHVDVGCVGAHGRTGTMIAVIKMLEDRSLEAGDAVRWVRNNYCDHAIETDGQVEFIKRAKEVIG